MEVYQAWEDEDGVTFATTENIEDFKKKGLLSLAAKLLYQIEANEYDVPSKYPNEICRFK